MDIAQQKRAENVAEYILYIWQLEDLVRGLQFSPEAIYTTLVAPRKASGEWSEAAFEWYCDIARLLQKEGKEQNGHLDHTLHLIAGLHDLHLTLMQQSAGKEYRERFASLAPELPALRKTLGRVESDMSDTELMFRVLYATMLYRIKGEKNTLTDSVTMLVSPVVATLSDLFHKAERGEIDLYR